MQKLLHLTLVLLLSMTAVAMRAEVVADFVETFDTADPSASGYHPLGWDRHFYSNYYAATYSSIDLGDGNKAIEVEQKYPGSSGYDDYLITPEVSGKVTLQLKLSGSGGSMKFYKIMETANGSFSKGDELLPDIAPALSTDEFQEYGFSDLQPGTRLGLRGHDVIFDDFSAAIANVNYKRSLDFYRVTLAESEPVFINTGSSYSPNYSITLSEGNRLSLTFDITIDNDGEVSFAPGDEGYEISLKVGSTSYGTQPIDMDLAPGERKSQSITFSFDASALSGKVTFNLTEEISGSSEWQYITIVPYKPEFKLQNAESTSSYSTIYNGSTLDFGSSQTATDDKVWIYNTGTAPLSFDMELEGEGFTASTDGVTTVAAGEHIACTLSTVADGNFGPRTAQLKFNITDLGEFSVTLKANMIDPDRWFENFVSKELPANMIAEGNVWQFTSGMAVVSTNYDGLKLITPKLEVTPEESLSIKIAKNGSSYYQTPSFKAYLSTDRKEWTEIQGDFPTSNLDSDFKEFTIAGIPTGQYYIGFDCSNVRISEFYGYRLVEVKHDVIVTNESLPISGEVNSLYKASLTVRNVGPTLEEGTYKAVLTVNGEAVSESLPQTLSSGATSTCELAFTPHEALTDATANIRLITTGDEEPEVIATSSVIPVKIAEEMMRGEVTVGAMSSATTDKTPVKASHKYTYSDIIYYADQIPLESGAKINKIAFKGKNSTAGANGRIRVWIENTETSSIPTSQAIWSDLNDAEATKDFTWEFPVTDGEEILAIDLSDAPFVYEGANLRLRFKNEIEKTGTINYCTDTKAGTAVYDYDNSASYIPKSYNAQAPVAFISVAVNPIVASGNVTDSASGDPITGAAVTISSGDVEYYGKTNAEGHYEVELKKDVGGYYVNVMSAGYFPYHAPLGEVVDNAVSHDVVLTAARDLYLKSQQIPTSMTVNEEYTLQALVQNVNKEAFAESSYHVTLLVDNEAIESAVGEALAANTDMLDNPESEHPFTFIYTPHTPGLHQIGFIVDIDGNKSYKGTTVEVNVEEEKAKGEVRVGEPSGYSNSAPVSLFYSYSTSSTLYPASKIDVPADAEIEEISYHGYYTSLSSSDAEIEVWMANTEDGETAEPVFDTTGMVKVATKTLHFDRTGTEAYPVEMMSFTLDEPFIYTGANLRIVLRTESNGYNANFEVDDSGITWFKKGNASFETLEAAAPQSEDMSVVRFRYNNSRTFRGTVISEETSEPVAGASVRLTSGNVRYSGETDDFGQFEIPVIKHGKSYNMDVTADGFLPLSLESIDLTEERIHKLKVDPESGVQTLTTEGWINDDDAYNLRGIKAGDADKGVVIKKGRKLINNTK